MLFVIFVVTKCSKTFLFCFVLWRFSTCVEVIALCIGFVPWLCASSCVQDWVCILYGILNRESWNPSRWRLVRGVWCSNLEIYPCVCVLLSLSKLYSLYILHCYYYSSIHAWYYSCVHTCIDPRDLLKHLNSYKRGIFRRSSRALHWNLASLFGYLLW